MPATVKQRMFVIAAAYVADPMTGLVRRKDLHDHLWIESRPADMQKRLEAACEDGLMEPVSWGVYRVKLEAILCPRAHSPLPVFNRSKNKKARAIALAPTNNGHTYSGFSNENSAGAANTGAEFARASEDRDATQSPRGKPCASPSSSERNPPFSDVAGGEPAAHAASTGAPPGGPGEQGAIARAAGQSATRPPDRAREIRPFGSGVELRNAHAGAGARIEEEEEEPIPPPQSPEDAERARSLLYDSGAAWTNAGVWARRVPLEVVQEAIRLVYPQGVPTPRERATNGGLVVYKLKTGEAAAELERRSRTARPPNRATPPPPRELPPTDERLADEVLTAIHGAVGEPAFARYFRHQVIVRATAAAAVLVVPTGIVAELVAQKFNGSIVDALESLSIGAVRFQVEAWAFEGREARR